VGHASIHENRPIGSEAQALVEADLVDLCIQMEAAFAPGGRHLHGRDDHGFRDALASMVPAYDDAADLHACGRGDEPHGTADFAIPDGDEMGRGEVVGIELLLIGHILFTNENLTAQAEAGIAEHAEDGDSKNDRIDHVRHLRLNEKPLRRIVAKAEISSSVEMPCSF